MNFLKQCYIELVNLKFSEENITELFSIRNKIIKFLKSKNPDRLKDHALHFVLLTKEREFNRFKDKQLKNNLKDNFEEAKGSLKFDLRRECVDYLDPIKDPWFDVPVSS